MLAGCKLIGFVPTKDSARSREFYEGKLGFQFVSDDQFALVMQAGESMIRIAKAGKFMPAQYTVMGWEVTDIEAMVKWLNCDEVLRLRNIPLFRTKNKASGPRPNGDKVAWFKDPDGNVLSLSQHL